MKSFSLVTTVITVCFPRRTLRIAGGFNRPVDGQHCVKPRTGYLPVIIPERYWAVHYR